MLVECYEEGKKNSFTLNLPASVCLTVGDHIIYRDLTYSIKRTIYNDDKGYLEFCVIPISSEPAIAAKYDSEVIDLVNQGTKLMAVKLVHDKYKLGLKEAKDVVDEISAMK